MSLHRPAPPPPCFSSGQAMDLDRKQIHLVPPEDLLKPRGREEQLPFTAPLCSGGKRPGGFQTVGKVEGLTVKGHAGEQVKARLIRPLTEDARGGESQDSWSPVSAEDFPNGKEGRPMEPFGMGHQGTRLTSAQPCVNPAGLVSKPWFSAS